MGDVFDEHPPRGELSHESIKLPPEPGAIGRLLAGADALAFPSGRELLAGEASAEDVDARKDVEPRARKSANCSDIVVNPRIRPATAENMTGEWIAFDLKQRGPEPGPFQAKLKATNAGEQGADHARVLRTHGRDG